MDMTAITRRGANVERTNSPVNGNCWIVTEPSGAKVWFRNKLSAIQYARRVVGLQPIAQQIARREAA